jgi:hypothetical protein
MQVHLVFVTKYRRHVLDSAGTNAVRTMFTTMCQDFGADLQACDGEDDHVHLLVEYPPSVAIPKLVNSLQGESSRRLRQQRPRRCPALLERRSVVAVLLRGIVRRRSARYHPTVCGAAKEHGLNPALRPGLRPSGLVKMSCQGACRPCAWGQRPAEAAVANE